MVTDDQILLFHSSNHLAMIKRLCDKAEKGPPHEFCSIDGDTTVMNKTRNAAYRAAGSMIAAVDAIYSTEVPVHGKARSAFCCVRPPGHHAERNKACGFCFLNNAAIGARFAQDRYGVKKVAVIDFDVHHGNGTEEGFIPDETLFYGSTHELDNFPGTGRDPSPYVGVKAKKPLHRRIVNRTLNAGPCSVKQFHNKWYVRSDPASTVQHRVSLQDIVVVLLLSVALYCCRIRLLTPLVDRCRQPCTGHKSSMK